MFSLKASLRIWKRDLWIRFLISLQELEKFGSVFDNSTYCVALLFNYAEDASLQETSILLGIVTVR